MAGSALTQAASLVFSAPSTTVATSATRTVGAVAIGDDDGPVLLAGLKLVVIVDGPSLIGAVEIALGLVYVGAGKGGAQSFQAEAVGGQSGGICAHAYGGALASPLMLTRPTPCNWEILVEPCAFQRALRRWARERWRR